MTPIPPAWASAMASLASVTVSMAEETIGMFKLIVEVSFVFSSAAPGRTAECPGRSSTSSKVSASLSEGRAIKANANSVICLPAAACLAAPPQEFGATDFVENSTGRELPTAHSTPGPERKGERASASKRQDFGTPHSHDGWLPRFSQGKKKIALASWIAHHCKPRSNNERSAMGKKLEQVKTQHRPARRSNAASAIAEAEFAAMDFELWQEGGWFHDVCNRVAGLKP